MQNCGNTGVYGVDERLVIARQLPEDGTSCGFFEVFQSHLALLGVAVQHEPHLVLRVAELREEREAPARVPHRGHIESRDNQNRVRQPQHFEDTAVERVSRVDDDDVEHAAEQDEHLQQKAWALAQQQATVENLALAQRNQTQKLEAKLAEQLNSIKERNLDVERAQAQTRALQRRIEELETERQHAQVSGMAQAEQLSRQSVTQMDELNKQLAQKAAEIQDNAMSQSTLEQSLRSEIDRLIHEAQERNQILQDRNDEVVRVKTEMDLLLDRFTQLESSASQSEATLTVDTEQMRTEFQAQLALLQAELSQKEWALEERNATARGLEHHYLQEIESLRQQLAQKEIAKREDDHDFVLGEPQTQQEQNDAFQVAEGVRSLDGYSHQSEHERRWRSGFGWKRRWKS